MAMIERTIENTSGIPLEELVLAAWRSVRRAVSRMAGVQPWRMVTTLSAAHLLFISAAHAEHEAGGSDIHHPYGGAQRWGEGQTIGYARAAQQSLLHGVAQVRQLDFFTGEFPVARLEYVDGTLPVAVTAEIFSPFVPHHSRESGTPDSTFALS